MSYLTKIERCNRRDLRGYLPFIVDEIQVGWLTPQRAAALKAHPRIFAAAVGGIGFNAALTTPSQRSRALADAVAELAKTGLFSRLRGELYAVKNLWSDQTLFRIDRGLVANFGVRAYGVHVNGIVRKRDGLHLWIGTRASDAKVEPSKLDNMVAGGQPAGLSLAANLVKECEEEAHIGAKLARTARCVNTISYAFETPEGVKVDTLFCYDLTVPATFTPQPSEEITRYQLMPIAKALSLASRTDRFKFNVSLVVIDCAIRHGLITPENEPNFDAIVAGLHERPQPIV